MSDRKRRTADGALRATELMEVDSWFIGFYCYFLDFTAGGISFSSEPFRMKGLMVKPYYAFELFTVRQDRDSRI